MDNRDGMYIEGQNNFIFCALSSDSQKRGFIDSALPDPTSPTPPSFYHQIAAGDPKTLVNQLFNRNEADAGIRLGTVQPNGKIDLAAQPGSNPIKYGVVFHLGPIGQPNRPVAPTGIICSSVFVIRSSVPLLVRPMSVDRTTTGHVEEWQAGAGWQTIDSFGAEGVVSQGVNTYYYRVLLDDAELLSTNSLVVAADQPSAIWLYACEIVDRHEEIEIAAGTPALIGILRRSLTENQFPEGVFMKITDPSGHSYQQPLSDKEHIIDMVGNAVRAFHFANPSRGKWTVSIVAPSNASFQAFIQTLPANDVAATIQDAFNSPEWKSQKRSWDLCQFCTECVASLASVLSFGAFLWFTPYTLTYWAAFASAAGPFFLTGKSAKTIAEALCSKVGACSSIENRLATQLARANPRYDQLCFLTTHNAFAYKSYYGLNYAQQTYDLPAQLAKGVRGLMLDIYTFQPPGGAVDFYLCHNGCSDAYEHAFIRPDWAPMSLRSALVTIVRFLSNNPQAIITLFLESRLAGLPTWIKNTMNNILASTGANNYLFRPDQLVQPNGHQWDFTKNGWPTIQWMQQNNCRLVMFSDRNAEVKNTGRSTLTGQLKQQLTPIMDDAIPYQWEYIVETDYGDASMGGDCKERDGSASLGDKRKSLFLQNYFPDGGAGNVLPLLYADRNSSLKIRQRTEGYSTVAGRYPNFLAVDFFEIGDEGGPLAALSAINDHWLT